MTTNTALATREQDASDFQIGAPVAVVPMHRGAAIELSSPAEIAAYMAQKNEEQIIAAATGVMIQEWFYSFPVSGKEVEGISVTGAMEMARLRAEAGFPIRFPMDAMRVEEIVQNGEPGIRAIVLARCVRSGAEGLGMAFYPFNAKRRNGGTEPDPHADRKALSVAKRNAVLDVIPEAAAKEILRAWKTGTQPQAPRQGRASVARGGGQRQLAAPAQPAEPHVTTATLDALVEAMQDEFVSPRARQHVQQKIAAGLAEPAAQRLLAQVREQAAKLREQAERTPAPKAVADHGDDPYTGPDDHGNERGEGSA